MSVTSRLAGVLPSSDDASTAISPITAIQNLKQRCNGIYSVFDAIDLGQLQEAVRMEPLPDNPTWDDLVAREPQLDDLLADAKAVRYCCWSCAWYGRPASDRAPKLPGLKKRLVHLVGWSSRHENPGIRESAVYDKAYFTVISAIPEGTAHRCRWCGEKCA